MRRPIYLDYQATTPTDPRVVAAMLPFFGDIFGNAASSDHLFGAEASSAVEAARTHVASLVGGTPAEIVFTSGATEADNLALLGGVPDSSGTQDHVVTCVTEHKAVLETCAELERRGCRVTYLPVASSGIISPDDVRRAITSRTRLISVMAANNEIGVLHPITEIGAIAREAGVLFHTDAAQAAACRLDVDRDNLDLLSLSSHKIYGPKGVGALFVRRRERRVRLQPQTYGGGHERGFRSGTINVPGVVGFGAAAQLLMQEHDEVLRVRALRDYFWDLLRAEVPHVRMNGSAKERLAGNLSVVLPGVSNRSLLVALRDTVAISTGSACSTLSVQPSHVIAAIDSDPRTAMETIRIGFGRFTSRDDVQAAARSLISAVEELRVLAEPAV